MGNNNDGFMLISKYRKPLMGVAALLILYFHEWIIVFRDLPGLYHVQYILKLTSFSGVDIFFFLSGVGLVYSIKKHSLSQFYLRRVRRILIPFLTMGLLSAIFLGWTTATFLKNILAINFFLKDIYSFLWFVPAILTLYLLFPLYYKLFSKAMHKAVFTTGAMIVWLLLTLIFSEFIRYDMYGFTNRIPIFLIGILVGELQQTRDFTFTPGTWLVLLLALILGVYLNYQYKINELYLLVPAGDCCIPNILMAISFCFLGAKVFDILSTKASAIGSGFVKIFGFYGMICLEIYCVQEFIGVILMRLLTGFHFNSIINLIILAVSTAMAVALYYFNQYTLKGLSYTIQHFKAAKPIKEKSEE